MTKKEPMTAEERKRDLYELQKELLATLLKHDAISQAQHDKSLGDLTEKMGMQPNDRPNGKARDILMLQPGRLQRMVDPVKCPNVRFKPVWK